MYLIPFVRTSRAVVACTILPSHPILAVASSELFSYCVPFITNTPFNAINNMVLFLFYYFNYNESALDVMNQFKNKNIVRYNLEILLICFYLINYFTIKS